ncbi:hypothetical protein B0H13DRAFT_2373300 [Mycena leptocephala]|nr:hypothetical protein B0H13DRAFT_2373300 [Mycena leptocephala]
MDNGRIVGPVRLRRCLLLLPGQDEASFESPLNPDDPQDVLRAIDLLEAIVARCTPHFVHAGSTATCPLGKTIKNTQISMDAPHTISILGHIVEIINPKAVAAHDRLSVDEMQEIKLTGTTWALDDLLLRALIDELWKQVENAQMGLREMPLLKEALAGFPHSWSTGIPALLSDSGMAFVSERSASGPCLYCPEVP